MRLLELGLAGAFAVGGLRSLWVWARRGFVGRDGVDHLLYALHLTSRVGLWFAFAGLFAIYGTIDTAGRPALDELAELRWYVILPMVLAALQLVSGILLGRRPDR